ncbi:PREDICTED: multiple inositol polyphosphate phosphatase 1-like [Wasmannia auropunctata]|uniref:multiple inositol polyphosphate phosphatase 1-like n=1 Tax=Wasmannia auropunctata TaxID=64793 RepID=UPI0005EFD65D|nr:PREDICTED: multiple inositol polyphosphate phosphatase 1-like [Wasmannia auropunctata]
MLWKLSAEIFIFCIVADISLASVHSKRNDSYECRLGSNTPYRCVANYDESPLEYPDCVEKKIWLIFRHGTRYPGKKYIPRMIDDLPELQHVILRNYENGATSLSADDAALLKKWKLSFVQGNMMKLALEGENEMIDLGERYQARFPSLMPEAFDNQTYKYVSEIAHLMYITCAFETALNQSAVSPWCKIFSLNDFKVFEYIEDLELYWIDGYGYSLTYEQACAVLKDMFDSFGSKKGAMTTAYFTHSGTILKLIALLGLAKDAHPLTHDSFILRKKEDKRAWRSSIIDTFASNMAFVLYDCEYYGPSVLFMLQERPLYLPGCPKDRPCPLDTMRAIYPDRNEECQFDAMCHTTKQDN